LIAFLYKASLPPRVPDRFLFDAARVPSRFRATEPHRALGLDAMPDQ
jgi:hypothetical protein